jgi:NTP pyrophosphatase (non-canonical NTP hydrolase)
MTEKMFVYGLILQNAVWMFCWLLAKDTSRFQKLQNELGQWADATFGFRTPESLLNHLIEEVGEVREALTDESEWADCLTLLIDSYRLATGHTTNDLLDACFAKIEVNKKRTWNAPDENGISRHIKENE